jgi:hypothetical protein
VGKGPLAEAVRGAGASSAAWDSQLSSSRGSAAGACAACNRQMRCIICSAVQYTLLAVALAGGHLHGRRTDSSAAGAALRNTQVAILANGPGIPKAVLTRHGSGRMRSVQPHKCLLLALQVNTLVNFSNPVAFDHQRPRPCPKQPHSQRLKHDIGSSTIWG